MPSHKQGQRRIFRKHNDLQRCEPFSYLHFSGPASETQGLMPRPYQAGAETKSGSYLLPNDFI
jgi:hypothetical protein